MRIGPRKAIEVLQRRLQHLEGRIHTTHGEDLSFDRRECGALRSGIEALRAMVIPKPGEDDAIVIRQTWRGGAQVMLYRDGELAAELLVEDGGEDFMQVLAKGDVRVRWEAEELAQGA